MASDASKEGILIGELRSCLAKLGQTVDRPASRSVTSSSHGAHGGEFGSRDDLENRLAFSEEDAGHTHTNRSGAMTGLAGVQ
eukprot:59591-Rhodomonas_salina.1